MTTARDCAQERAVIYEGDASTLAALRTRLAALEAAQEGLEQLHLLETAAEVGLAAITLRLSKVRGYATCMSCLTYHQADVSVGGRDNLDFRPCERCA